MIKCAACGCTVTPESHKNHNYYSCTNFRKMHDKRIYVKEETIMEPIYEAAEKFKELSDEKIQEIIEGLKQSNERKNQFHKKSIAGLRAEYDSIDAKTNRLLDLRIDGSITEEMFTQKLKAYKERQVELNIKLQNYTDADETYYLTANKLMSVAQRAISILKSSEPDERRQFINFVFQNLKLDGQKHDFEFKTPFDTVLKLTGHCERRRERDSNPRTALRPSEVSNLLQCHYAIPPNNSDITFKFGLGQWI
jgi:hypothetical protein